MGGRPMPPSTRARKAPRKYQNTSESGTAKASGPVAPLRSRYYDHRPAQGKDSFTSPKRQRGMSSMRLGLINSAWAQAGRDTAFGIRMTKEIGFDTIDIFADPLDLPIKERRLIKGECDR